MFPTMAGLPTELRAALRSLRRSPLLVISAVLVGALGVGAPTALYSAIDATLLRPPPYASPERLAAVSMLTRNGQPGPVPDFLYAAWRAGCSVCSGLGAYRIGPQFIGGDGAIPERVETASVTPGFLAILGVRPELGTGGGPVGGLQSAKAPANAFLSWRLWQRRYRGSRSALGGRVKVSGSEYNISGVMPSGFAFPSSLPVDLILSSGEPKIAPDRPTYFYFVIARLRPGFGQRALAQQLGALGTGPLPLQATRSGGPGPPGGRLVVTDARPGDVERARPVLLLLFAAAFIVFLLACANVAFLLGTRTSARRSDYEFMQMLGATPVHLARRLLLEGLLLMGPACLLGLGAAYLGARAGWERAGALGTNLPRLEPNAGVFTFAVGITLLCAVLCQVPSYLGAMRPGRPRRGLHLGVLAGAQIALAMVLAGSAGLLIQGARQYFGTALGFRANGLWTARVAFQPPSTVGPGPVGPGGRFEALLGGLRSSGQFAAAAFASDLPLGGPRMEATLPTGGVDHRAVVRILINQVSTGYFSALGIPILRGRGFGDNDRWNSPQVAVVNRAFAREFFGSDEAIGSRLQEPDAPNGHLVTVVGVAADTPQLAPPAPVQPEMYRPLAQSTFIFEQYLAFRSRGVLTVLDLRRAIARLAPGAVVFDSEPMRARVASPYAQRGFMLAVLTTFSVISLGLASLGVYNAAAILALDARRSSAIRLVLGATRANVFLLAQRRLAYPCLAGLAAGLMGAVFAGSLLRSALAGVPPYHPATLALSSASIALLVALAGASPALGLALSNPLKAIREL